MASYLMALGHWNGPTLLLAPAGSRVQRLTQLPTLPSPFSLDGWAEGRALFPPIHVVHSLNDKVCRLSAFMLIGM
jgi:hypothetical protein